MGPNSKLYLSETKDTYNRRCEAAARKSEAERLVSLAISEALGAQASELERQGTGPAQKEINRREAVRLREQASGRKAWSQGAGRRLEKETAELLSLLRREEGEKIAFQGRILHSAPERTESDSRAERRVVSFDGRHFLCRLLYRAVMRDTGRTKKIKVGYHGRGEATVPILEPTREYRPPEVDWVTDDLTQFTDEELRAIA